MKMKPVNKQRYFSKLAFVGSLLGLSACGPRIQGFTQTNPPDEQEQSLEPSDEELNEPSLVPIDWTVGKLTSKLNRPPEIGEDWSRTLQLEGISDVANWIVEKTYLKKGREKIWRSVGVTDEHGTFTDFNIDKPAQYRIGQKVVSEQFGSVNDLVIDHKNICLGINKNETRNIQAFRVVFKLDQKDEIFLVKDCFLRVEAQEIKVENSFRWENPTEDEEPKVASDFDIKWIAKKIDVLDSVIFNLNGAKGLDGLPVPKAGMVEDKKDIFVDPPKNIDIPKAPAPKKKNLPDKKTLKDFVMGPLFEKETPSMNPFKPFFDKTNRTSSKRVASQDPEPLPLALDIKALQEILRLNVGEPGLKGIDGNDGSPGLPGGRFFVYSLKDPSLSVSFLGGEGGEGSDGGDGGDGGRGSRVYVSNDFNFFNVGISNLEDLLNPRPGYRLFGTAESGRAGFVGRDGKKGPSGKVGQYLWGPYENESQYQGFYDEQIE
jgi:hypothetical protein